VIDSPADTSSPDMRRIRVGWWIGLLLSCVLILYSELDRWTSFDTEDPVARAFDMLFDINIDTTPFAFLLLVLPVCWFARRNVLERSPRWFGRAAQWLAETPTSTASGTRRRAAILATLVALTALLSCIRVSRTIAEPNDAWRFGDLPPAFHDEYSYLFQARTFLAGEWSHPSHPDVPRIFDQMHVLNEGRFASRYFPGTGFWIAPFEATGDPYPGHWLATVIACVCTFAIGRELACNGVGLLAGLLAALSPGMVLFGNLLLAHQPTLAGLSVFVYCCLRLQRRCLSLSREIRSGDGGQTTLTGASSEVQRAAEHRAPVVLSLLAGIGLAFAMLCRPMTAAGIGLPFGVLLAVWLVRNGRAMRRPATAIVVGFAIPLVAGFGTILVQNHEITGDAFRSPYQVYTDLLTPSHMYGFDNVERAKSMQTDRVITHYDEWADNLDTALAVKNVRNRMLSSWQWTLGPVALIVSVFVVLAGAARNLDQRWWLIIAAIVSLHLLHVPYWFDGIMHWHYVFESGVLWCLLAAGATLLLFQLFRTGNRPWMPVWWCLLLLASVTVNHVSLRPFWGVSRLDAGISELSFSRVQFERFHRVVEEQVDQTPALVLIKHNPHDRHIDYVSNTPDLSAPILFGRVSADANTTEIETLRSAAQAYLDRSLYVAVAPMSPGQSWQFIRLR